MESYLKDQVVQKDGSNIKRYPSAKINTLIVSFS